MTGEETSLLLTIAVLGGTGKEGKGLAYRWARAGYRVLVGSRSPERAQVAAVELSSLLNGEAVIEGMSNPDAARIADIVILAVPYIAHREILESIRTLVQGKILVDVTVPLAQTKVTKFQIPPGGSAAQETRKILGEGVEVCTAFQNISYEHLMNTDELDCDILVTGTSKKARNEVLILVNAAGFKGWDAGPIENSIVVEGLTSVLIYINKRYNSTHAGVKITGAVLPT